MPNFGNIGRELAKEMNEEPEEEVETKDEHRDRLLLENMDSIITLQAIARGFVERRNQKSNRARIQLAERYMAKFQARSSRNSCDRQWQRVYTYVAL